ncbi:MAG: YbaN family protein [Fimbriimonadaceae bacterium]|nr:YbaN family protein [Fimbriimonadaceae bacterium]
MSVVLGVIGLFVPGWPTTIFMILALYCFKKGSARLERWLLEHRHFGPTLRDWEENGTIKLRTKRIAVGTMWTAIAFSALVLYAKPAVLAVVAALGAFGTWYILSRPTTVEDDLTRAAIEEEGETPSPMSPHRETATASTPPALR